MDPVNVSNQALGQLGGAFIQAFDEGTSLATLCGQTYPGVRDEVLELHPWNFAAFQSRLPLLAQDPVMTWRYMYALQTDPWCIKVRGTDEGSGAKFEVAMDRLAGRILYSNRANLAITYTGRVDDLGSWSPLAVQVLICLMASKLAKPLTGQNSLTELKYKEALTLLPQAQSSDGREGSPFRLRPNTRLTSARHGHTGRAWGWWDGGAW